MQGFINSFKPIFASFRNEIILLSISVGICIVSAVLFMQSNAMYSKNTDVESPAIYPSQSIKKTPIDMIIDVSGAVQHPGIYRLPVGSRMEDAIKKAGGLSEDCEKLFFARNYNLARILTDQEKIYIPTQEDLQSDVFGENTHILDYTLPSTMVAEESPGRINLNTASQDELESLPTVGEITAKKILDARPLQSVDDLWKKNIIGVNSFEQVKGFITVN